MTEFQIEALADEVVAAFQQSKLPVGIEDIASEENIELLEGDFGDEFHGRIEYLSNVETFVIYYPSFSSGQYPARVRFSIAHELGHYYIPLHRELLMKGMAHYSLEGFKHKDVIERQADVFAAALLIPSKVLRTRMGRRGFLTLHQILGLADECQASVQATAFRYTRFTKEPHLAVVSEDSKVLYSFGSEEARAIGYGSVRGQSVPDTSPTKRALHSTKIEEGKIISSAWFADRKSESMLWEEAVRLGSSNRILTLLSWVEYNPFAE